MKILVVCLVLVTTSAAASSTIEVPYESVELMITRTILTQGGRYYLRGEPGEECAYAFIQQPEVRAETQRLRLKFLFAARAGKMIAGRCIGPGDNFDVVVSGVPRYADGALYLDHVSLDADHKLFDLFSGLFESQLAPLLRMPLESIVSGHIALLTSRGAGVVRLDAMDVDAIELGSNAVRIRADFVVSVAP